MSRAADAPPLPGFERIEPLAPVGGSASAGGALPASACGLAQSATPDDVRGGAGPSPLRADLAAFSRGHGFDGKGALCVALVVTRHAIRLGLPLEPEALLTNRGGQVLGLGRAAVQAILAEHGETRVLAHEGGRTSRGSIENMRSYAACLNALAATGPVDLAAVEAFWIDAVRGFLAAKPFRLRLDPAHGLRALFADLLGQAVEREREARGMKYAGALLQHLVGAALEGDLEPGRLSHHGFAAADAAAARAGDFLVGDVAIHVTTAPGEAVIRRCRDNVEGGLRAVLVTVDRKLGLAEGLAENAGLRDRIDVLSAEQFLAASLHRAGGFTPDGRRAGLAAFVERYNRIVAACETDPSLAIDFEA